MRGREEEEVLVRLGKIDDVIIMTGGLLGGSELDMIAVIIVTGMLSLRVGNEAVVTGM